MSRKRGRATRVALGRMDHLIEHDRLELKWDKPIGKTPADAECGTLTTDSDGLFQTHELLKRLPAEWSRQIAIYHGSDAGSWYVAGCPGLLIQNIELPPIVGWWRV